MEEIKIKRAREAALQFALYGDLESIAPFGGGHINDTFVSVWNQAGTRVRYVHQRINASVFLHPEEVMENIRRVTEHIAAKFRDVPDRSRRTLTVVPARSGAAYIRDPQGGWWRTYLFIEGTRSLDVTSSPGTATFLGKSIGAFQKLLADLPPPRLYETIPDFHNMETRYVRFHKAVAEDTFRRAALSAPEIEFMRENEARGGILVRALRSGAIPERICHNDTKMNNILLDDRLFGRADGNFDPAGEFLDLQNRDEKIFCVGDLDTVMPGTCLFDVGDLIRTVCASAPEDEIDLAKVRFDPVFLKALLDGYLSEADGFLTLEEKNLILESGRNITQIMALRFLTDFLEGDHYYPIAREGHNLDRCRNQIALIKSLDAQGDSLSF